MEFNSIENIYFYYEIIIKSQQHVSSVSHDLIFLEFTSENGTPLRWSGVYMTHLLLLSAMDGVLAYATSQLISPKYPIL